MPQSDPIHRIAFCDLHYWRHISSGGDPDRWEPVVPAENPEPCQVAKCKEIAMFWEKEISTND